MLPTTWIGCVPTKPWPLRMSRHVNQRCTGLTGRLTFPTIPPVQNRHTGRGIPRGLREDTAQPSSFSNTRDMRPIRSCAKDKMIDDGVRGGKIWQRALSLARSPTASARQRRNLFPFRSGWSLTRSPWPCCLQFYFSVVEASSRVLIRYDV